MAGGNLHIQTIGDVTVVNFIEASILDAGSINSIGQQLYELVDTQDRKKLVLDFEKVRFLSSMALGVLINLRKKSAAIKGSVALCSLRPELFRVFKISKLDKLFKCYENEEKALNSFDVYTT